MRILVKQLLLGGSATALIIGAGATTAFAQDAIPSEAITTVEVSGSRINLAGFQSPTPVTVIGLEQIQRNAQLNIGDEIRDLPQVSGTPTQTANVNDLSQGDSGIDTLSLRNLGAQRNLVLFDHQRVALTGIQGGTVDLSTIPSSLIQRVDVVTGGASAAWGSDAVTGVINIVINKNFEGFKANGEYQNNTLIPVPRYHYEAAWGTSFMNGLGHFEIGYNANVSNTPSFAGENPHNNGRTDVYNPAYCSQVTYAPGATTGGTCTSLAGAPLEQYVYNAGVNTYTQGGLINSTTVGTTGSSLTSTTALKGIMFVGQNDAPTEFNYGSTFNNTTCYNGCTNNQYTSGNTDWTSTSLPYHDDTVFTYTSFQLTPDIKASVQLGRGGYQNHGSGILLNSTSQTIYADNAYLPASIQQRFVCNGTASASCVTTLSNGYNPFTMTGGLGAKPNQDLVMGIDFGNNRIGPANSSGDVTGIQPAQSAAPGIWSLANDCSAIGVACYYYNRVFNRASFQLDGTLSDDWNWSSYLAYSGLRQRETMPNDAEVKTRLVYALDAVLVTSSNVGSSGLPIGSIQCRALLQPYSLSVATVASDLAGCQPINVFGSGNISQAAYEWISPGVNPSSGFLDGVEMETNQVAASGSVTGVLPWRLPAGEVAVAFGAEYSLNQAGNYKADPIGARNVLMAANFTNFSGEYNVKEGYLEINAPILKDNFVQSLDVDLAGRFTDYSTSGAVQTWKLGLNSQIDDDFRVRAFISSDIRAPDVYDLFNPGGANSQQCPAWVTGGPTNPCSAIPGGNPCLVPEQANTTSVGLVMTPHWIDGLTASLDWYDLRMHGAITSVAYGSVISYAQQGQTAYCASIITSTGANICNYSTAAGTTGVPQIIDVRTGGVNASRLTTAGFDANIDYRFDLGSGQASVGVDASYVYDWSRTLLGVYYQGAGATGGVYPGGPNFKTTINLVYRLAAWTFGAEIHGTGNAVRDLGTEGQPGVVYSAVTYTRINGVDVASISSGENGQGILPTNYSPWYGNLGLRLQYKWSDTVQLYGAMDNVFPGNGSNLTVPQGKTYRFGVRFNI